MNKKLFALIALFCSLILLASCSDDDSGIDEEWKAYNENIYRKAAANTDYKSRNSFSGNGTVYWKYTDFFDIEDEKNGIKTMLPKITESGSPYSTDSVIVRYEGWFFLKDSTKYIFDSTEGDNNAQAGRGFRISGVSSTGAFTGVVDGWITMLINMKVGDAVEVCIPSELGYKAAGLSDNYYNEIIPGYTTLWFNIKLLKIIPDNPGEFD